MAETLDRFVFARRAVGPLAQGSFRSLLRPLRRQPEIPNNAHDLFFPRSSTWALPEGRPRYVCDPGVVSFWSHGQVCLREPAGSPAVDGEFFSFPTAIAEELVAAQGARGGDDRWLWPRQAIPVGTEIFARQRRLVAAIQDQRIETDAAVEAILTLAADCLRSGGAVAAPSRRDRELAEAVRLRVSADPAGRTALEALAREAGVGPVTLCTTFRRVTGQSIHAYRLDLRLKLSLERLERDGDDLARIAVELGFDSHSHFSRHFRKRFGISPSSLRRDLIGLGRLRPKERDSAPHDEAVLLGACIASPSSRS